MSLNLVITEETKLNKALLNVIRSENNVDALKMIKKMEDLAGLIYSALPNKSAKVFYLQRMNCNVCWYVAENKLSVSFLLFLNAMVFEPVADGVSLVDIEGDWPINWLIKLLEDAIAHYLTPDGTAFKEIIPSYGMKEAIEESKAKKSV